MFSQVDYGEKNWADQYFSSIQNGVSQRESMVSFVQSAAEIGAGIQLVIPTKIAFSQSAGQAIASGSYGDRRQLDPLYFDLLDDYISEFLSVSAENGVEVSRIEIGNEFWGSGEMTAQEYGFLAASVTEYISNNFPELDVIAQVSYIAGYFSPVEDSQVYLVENGADFDIYFPWQDLENISGLEEHVLPGQGSGVGQTQDIAEQFLDNPTALSSLDGIVDHIYFRTGFDGIDNERNHGLTAIPQIFEDITGLEGIDTYITEWSVSNSSGDHDSEGTNHTGLQYASSTLEAFFELVQHGVTGANFWPTTFGNETIDRRVLIDTSEQDLTFGGEIFRMLSTNLIGLSAIFDYEVDGEMDIHGFSSSDTMVFFASERSGSNSTVEIDFSNYAFDDKAFISITYLSSDDPTGVEIASNPVLNELGGVSANVQTIELDLDPWSLAMVNIQDITQSDDELIGTSQNDHIAGDAGDDVLSGVEGDDRLYGQFGHDTLYGGSGHDSLYGGWGNDVLQGGQGNDFIAGTYGDNTLYGGAGDDEIQAGSGNDFIKAGDDNDNVILGAGASFTDAGAGNDEITLSPSGTTWGADFWAVNSSFTSHSGWETGVSVEGLQKSSAIVSGGVGMDTLSLSDEDDAFFLDDSYSDFHVEGGALELSSGVLGVARISGVEHIQSGLGDDVIDLTSSRYSLKDTNIEILGEQGDDIIWGSDANENIFGGAGNDQLFGGEGRDTLTGGTGQDTFDFNITSSGDLITDFNASEGDVLRVFGTEMSDLHEVSWKDGVLSIDFSFEDLVRSFTVNVNFESDSSEVSVLSDGWANSLEFL